MIPSKNTFGSIRLMRSILTVLTALIFSSSIQAQTVSNDISEYFKPENILSFANHLYEEADYARAAGEYRRFLFAAGDAEGSDSIYYKMIKAVFLAGDHEDCLKFLDAYKDRYSRSSRIDDVPLYKSIVEHNHGNFSRSIALLDTASVSMPHLKNVVIAMDYIFLSDLNNASSWVCGDGGEFVRQDADPLPNYHEQVRYLCKQIASADSIGHKSKLLAGLLSTVVPGSGKVYCDRTMDGIYSLIIVGLSLWQAYDGFADNGTSSGKGWILGALGTGFYLGNIYGSVIAADQYNNKAFKKFRDGLQIEITLP